VKASPRSADAAEAAASVLPKDFLRPSLLLLIGERPSYGYDLLERLRGLGSRPIDPGTLYRSLRAMEQERLVGSEWRDSEVGPARRTYRLTDAGRDWLHAWAMSLRETRRTMDAFLGRCDDLADGGVDPAERARPVGRIC